MKTCLVQSVTHKGRYCHVQAMHQCHYYSAVIIYCSVKRHVSNFCPPLTAICEVSLLVCQCARDSLCPSPLALFHPHRHPASSCPSQTAISVSCGIPDFRSEHGVYDLVSRLDLGLSSAEDLFDLEFFVDDPEPFFKFAKARAGLE